MCKEGGGVGSDLVKVYGHLTAHVVRDISGALIVYIRTSIKAAQCVWNILWDLNGYTRWLCGQSAMGTYKRTCI